MPAVPVVPPHAVHRVQREEGPSSRELGGELRGQTDEGVVAHGSQPVLGEEGQVVLHQLSSLLLLQRVAVEEDLDVQLQERHTSSHAVDVAVSDTPPTPPQSASPLPTPAAPLDSPE